jgi:hypothetical protein
MRKGLMAKSKQIDNHDPRVKLDLRRYMLRRWHGPGEPIRVMDCCSGSGVLWTTLRKEFAIASYFPLDVKPKPGRLKIESERVLAQPGWKENVIDCDTYGSPWTLWAALLPNVKQPTTVFLTIGTTMFAGSVDRSAYGMLGLGKLASLDCFPVSFGRKLSELATSYAIGDAARHGLNVADAVEAISDGSARYLGVRLTPAA